MTTERRAETVNSDHESFASWKIAAVWIIPALLSTVETVMFARAGGHPIAAWRAFVGEAPQWFGWAVLTPAIIALGARYPLRRPVRASAVLVHASASLAASLALAFCDALVNAWVRPSTSGLVAMTRNWFLGGLPATTLVYCAVLIASYAWRDSTRLRRREREAGVLEAQLRDAQLSALRMQLHPHFLFNSLNAIMALVRDQDTTRAVQALSLLSDVLRATITAGDNHETTLAEEIDFVTRYLAIEQLRFGDRLRVSIDVDDEVTDARVPVFILQPFVENALKHGVLRERAGNRITIRARPQASTLILDVCDDGRGLTAPTVPTSGVGIANARRRLERMYGARASLVVSNARNGNGVDVQITMPLALTPISAKPPIPTIEVGV
jgi:two-component system LytT family sensor kinase